jgi:glycosyltransferase involved in cell wall biosynthesis
MPSISIITAVKNAVHTIGACIESAGRQTHPAEHIIIDGGSTDGTLDVIRDVSRGVPAPVSEPDRGMYHAMNKGLLRAGGDVVGILNGDDEYAGPRVLERVAGAFAAGADSCYGDLVVVDPRDATRVVRTWRAGAYDRRRFYWGWMPPHPTFFVRRSLYRDLGPFRLDLGTAADYELMLRFLVRGGISAAYVPDVLVRMRGGGASNASVRRRIEANRKDRTAWRVNGLRPYPWMLWLKPIRKLEQFFV